MKALRLKKAVVRISSRRLLHKVLKIHKEAVGSFFGSIRSIKALQFPSDNLGTECHTSSSEPYFYDQSYVVV